MSYTTAGRATQPQPSRTARRATSSSLPLALLALLAGVVGVGGQAAPALAADATGSTASTSVPVVFDFTGGTQTYTVPAGAAALEVVLDGAAGGGWAYDGGSSSGARVRAVVPVGPASSVQAGDELVVTVGGVGGDPNWGYGESQPQTGGYNGGGSGGEYYDDEGFGSGGGGATDLRLPSAGLADRILVAGGGGGHGGGARGGDGGQDAAASDGRGNNVLGGAAGTATAGGRGGTRYTGDPEAGGDGAFGVGGTGGYSGSVPGSGGGGGYYGGGGGAGAIFSGGGGGGSNHVTPEARAAWFSLAEDAASATITPLPALPSITTTTDQTVEATGATGASVTYPVPSATDGRDDALAVDCSVPSGALFPIGTTEVTCRAADQGYELSDTFTVTVVDRTAPVVATHENVSVTATPGATSAAVTYLAPIATDAVDGPVAATCAPASGSAFPVGTTTIACTATDRAGNTGTRSFAITVNASAPVANKADVKALLTGPATAKAGTKVTYTLTVTNNGPAAATGVTSALSTTGLAGVTASTGGRTGSLKIGTVTVSGTTWTVPTLAAGQSATHKVTGTVGAKKGQSVTLLGGAASPVADPDPLNNTTSLSAMVS